MSSEEFIEGFKDAVGTAYAVRPETLLADIPEWDSLTIMSTVTFLAVQCNANVTFTELKDAVKVSDIMSKAGILS